MLSPETVDLLRQWWKVRRGFDDNNALQERWLFPGRRLGKPMTTRQLSRLFHEAADEAGIKKSVMTLHALRHSFATHLLERGTDMHHPGALGHDKLDTTARYTRVATGMIASVESLLDLLSQPRKLPRKPKRRAGKTSRRRNGAMSCPALEVADIFRDHGAAWRKANAGHVSLGQDEGHECDRALPHGGARRPCGALRERQVRPHGHRLPAAATGTRPAPGRCRQGMARRA